MVYKPKKYEWRGFKYSLDANVAGAVVEEVERENGIVTPDAFLNKARADDSPIHSMFTWDDSVAAEKYRLQEARNIIRCLSVTIIKSDDAPKSYTAYVNIAEKKNEGKYLNINDAFEDDDTRSIVLGRALKELEAFANKYSLLEELEEVFTAINEFKEKIA